MPKLNIILEKAEKMKKIEIIEREEKIETSIDFIEHFHCLNA
jgi:hypothetical protein